MRYYKARIKRFSQDIDKKWPNTHDFNLREKVEFYLIKVFNETKKI